jgi:ATP-dependent Clp protease ATP-binding subunit ClpA
MSAGYERKPKANALVELLSQKVVGQPDALTHIVPYIELAQAGLAPRSRPLGVFLLLGPTGTGKTRTVEVLAEALHGSDRRFVRVDCGEFQMEHDVAKLIGAPPGYVGHRETVPVLTQQNLDAVTSERANISIVLFDEIEKAAPSLAPLLLGILDRATLRLSDNNDVNFERSLIFMTSNLGAREMMSEINPSFGFQRDKAHEAGVEVKLNAIALGAVRKRFSPEFVNRIDVVITYRLLDDEALRTILDHQLKELQEHINTSLADRWFEIEVPEETRRFFLHHGTSAQFGARELKRTIHRHLMQPLATLVAAGGIEPGSLVRAELIGSGVAIRQMGKATRVESDRPTILMVDDNRDLLRFLQTWMTEAGCNVHIAETPEEARDLASRQNLQAVFVDSILLTGNGVRLAVELHHRLPHAIVVIMTDDDLTPEEREIAENFNFSVLRKPFLPTFALAILNDRMQGTPRASGQAVD